MIAAATLRDRAGDMRRNGWSIADHVTPHHLEMAAAEIDRLRYAIQIIHDSLAGMDGPNATEIRRMCAGALGRHAPSPAT